MRVILFTILLLLSAGCRRSDEPSSSRADGQKFLRCAEPNDDGVNESFNIPPLVLERRGYNLNINGIKSAMVTVGLLAGIAEASAANLANLDFFISGFKEAGAQIIAVAGGIGSTEEDMDKIIQRLTTAPVPILLVPGAEENFDVFRKLVEKHRQTAPQLIDMTRVRQVQAGKINLVSLPGYHKPFYLTAKNRGCAYQKEDVELTGKLFVDKGLNVILSPSPPKGEGVNATDRARGQVNIGDSDLTKMLKERKVRFGMFGHVYEAGGNAVTCDGIAAAPSGIWNECLWIQAGAADALPMFLSGEGRAAGMAQIVSFSADRARYQTLNALQK